MMDANVMEFQFHSGSIKTLRPRRDLTLEWVVSIPLWFD